MSMRLGVRGNQFGLASLLCSLAFWAYISIPVTASRVPASTYITFIVLPLDLVVAFAAAIIAAAKGSRWWLLALLAPIVGALGLLSASG